MLTLNGRSVFGCPGTFSGAYRNQNGNVVKGGFRNRFVGGFDKTFGAFPSGQVAPSAFVLPQTAGGMASYNESPITLSNISITLTPGAPMTATGVLVLATLNSQLDQIYPLTATGALTLTSTADLAAAVNAQATGILVLNVASATLGGIFSVSANGTLTLSGTENMTALAFIETDLSPATMTAESIAAAVWEALSSEHVTQGTMAEELKKRLKKSDFIALK